MESNKNDEMANEIATRLREGYVIDLKKPEFDHFQRAAVIRQVLDDKGWSIRKMAREYNIPKSTLEDWLLFNRIDETEYNELKSEGHTHTQIYRALRDNKQKTKKEQLSDIDVFLNKLHREVCSYKRNPTYSQRTKDNIDVVINDLRELKANINISEKKKNGA